MLITIDPSGNILYKSFYIAALAERFGTVRFLSAPFADLPAEVRGGNRTLFIAQGEGRERRFAIDGSDQSAVEAALYDWCDVYGHVNANLALTPSALRPKLVPLCPSFAVRCWSVPQTLYQSVRSLPNCQSSVRKHFGKHKRLLQRQPMRAYGPTEVEQGFVFHCSTLWQSDEWNLNDQECNLARAWFIRACKATPGLKFEGGLVSHRSDLADKQFADCAIGTAISSARYLELARRSMFVFNTPSYWGCNGWKLGEYMALGKAMLTTPLVNDLPEPLVGGVHAHLVDKTSEDIAAGVAYLSLHPAYCRTLGQNLYQYWQNYGSPQATLKLLGL